MPCYEVRTVSVKFQAKHKAVLETAIKNLGWEFYYNTDSSKIRIVGQFTIDLEKQEAEIYNWQQADLNKLKQAYSSAALDKVAKMNMWVRSKGSDRKGVLSKY